jgi:hypothetical protein
LLPLAPRRRSLLGVWHWEQPRRTAGFLADRAILAPDTAQAAEAVESVNGKTGKVVLTAANVEAVPAADLTMLPGENLAIGEGAFASFIGESEAEHKKHRGNTAFGWHALHTLTGTKETSTEDNTAIGSQALGYLTTGGGNTAVGENAGLNLTTGEENVAIGCECLASQQTVSGNVAIGFQAGYENTTGISFVAIGEYAGQNQTTGDWNTYLGNGSGRYNTTGEFNTAVGTSALQGESGASTGSENTTLGCYALERVTTGSGNVALGCAAGTHLTTGGSNTALGAFALEENKTGTGNVAVGREAGKKETGSNKLYIANSESTEPLIHGVFPNEELTFNTLKIALYKGVTPVARHATIAVPGETTSANTKAIKEIIEAIKAIGIIS